MFVCLLSVTLSQVWRQKIYGGNFFFCKTVEHSATVSAAVVGEARKTSQQDLERVTAIRFALLSPSRDGLWLKNESSCPGRFKLSPEDAPTSANSARMTKF